MDAALSPLVLWSLRFLEKGLLYFYSDLFGQLNFLKMAVTSAEDYRSFEEYVNKYEDNKRFNYFFVFCLLEFMSFLYEISLSFEN